MKKILMLFSAAALVACTSFFLKGGSEYAGGAPPGALAHFVAKKCKMLASGQMINGPSGTYYLANTTKGPALYELDATGSGTSITNYWRDAKGHHFAAYVRGGQAWEYILPDDRTKPGVRKVFTQYQIRHVAGGFRIAGQPMAECPLTNSQTKAKPKAASAAAPAPQPAAASAEGGAASPAADGGAPAAPIPKGKLLCVPGTTQTCVGGGACRGGQYCLPSGRGYSPCDCGKKRR